MTLMLRIYNHLSGAPEVVVYNQRVMNCLLLLALVHIYGGKSVLHWRCLEIPFPVFCCRRLAYGTPEETGINRITCNMVRAVCTGWKTSMLNGCLKALFVKMRTSKANLLHHVSRPLLVCGNLDICCRSLMSNVVTSSGGYVVERTIFKIPKQTNGDHVLQKSMTPMLVVALDVNCCKDITLILCWKTSL